MKTRLALSPATSSSTAAASEAASGRFLCTHFLVSAQAPVLRPDDATVEERLQIPVQLADVVALARRAPIARSQIAASSGGESLGASFVGGR